MNSFIGSAKKNGRRVFGVICTVLLIAFAVALVPLPAYAATGSQNMYRLYNPYSGEHLYTADALEKTNLVKIGWKDEGIGWTAPLKSNTPVYRLYNGYTGDHHYTTSLSEYNACVAQGWTGEGIGFFSDDAKGTTVYRVYNKYLTAGTHHYTTNKKEYNDLGKIGWSQENIGWYGLTHTHTYKTVHHDAVTHQVWHDAVTETRYICNNCRADITSDPWGHIDASLLNGGNCGGYHNSVVTVKEGYSETVTDSAAYDERICTICGYSTR